MADRKIRPSPKAKRASPAGPGNEGLRRRLQEAEETLRAIRSGEVDALIIPGPRGNQVYTLKDADRTYRFIVEQMREGTATLAKDGTILFANKQFAAMLGLPLARVLGSLVHDYISVADRDAFRSLLARGLRGTARAEIVLAPGEKNPVSTYASLGPIRVDGGRVVAGVFMDITEDKRIRSNLQSSTAILGRIFEGTHFLIAFLDRTARFIRVNANFARALDRSPESLMGKRYEEVFPGSRHCAVLTRVLEMGVSFSAQGVPFEKELLSGRPTYWDMNIQPVKEPDGTMLGLILTLVDKSEQSIAEAERRNLEAAIEQAADGIAVTDPAGGVHYANRAMKDLLVAGGQPDGEPRPDLMLSEPFSRVQEVLRKRPFWKGHLTRTGRKGLPYSLDISVSPLLNARGEPDSYVMLFRDVTQAVRLEGKVRQMERMEALGRLAGGVAHDLNNILQPILINVEMLLEDTPPGTPQAERLQNVLLAAQRQKDLVRGILSFTRRMEPSRKPAFFRKMLSEVLTLLRPSVPAAVQVRLHTNVERDAILCDPSEVHQVILNLCSNAIEAMTGKEGVMDISLDAVRFEEAEPELRLGPGEYLKLSVSDNGRGIAPEVMGHIFEPFFTTKEPGRGTGIGLSIVHEIMKSCGGAIGVESRPGQGTTAEAYFPMTGEVRVAAESEAPLRTQPGDGRILLVDDEELVLTSLGPALRSLGFEVATASDGTQALELFRAAPDGFDLAIIDENMPRLTGMQVATQILRERPVFPIILVTGFSALVDESKARDIGIREILVKPASLQELTAAISRALSHPAPENPKAI